MPRALYNPSIAQTVAATAYHGSLLPYAIRNCTAKEMLYGGIRTQYLVQGAPQITYHQSARLKVPDQKRERNGIGLEYEHIPVRMMPMNVGHQNKYEMSILRNKDVYARFLKQNRAHADLANSANGANIAPVGTSSAALSSENFTVDGKHIASSSRVAQTNLEAREIALRGNDRKMYHVKKDQLSILGADRVGAQTQAFESQVNPVVSTIGTEVFNVGGEVYMPFQMVKPVSHSFSPAARVSGLTNPAGRLKQELQDRKGFGWQKKQRKLWNQDINTKGYHPDKFF